VIYSLIILLARNIISYLSRLVKISIYIIIYSSNENATSLIYYTLQLRKIVLASRGRVACALSRDQSFKSVRYYYMSVYIRHIYYIYIYLYIYIYIYIFFIFLILRAFCNHSDPPMGNIPRNSLID